MLSYAVVPMNKGESSFCLGDETIDVSALLNYLAAAIVAGLITMESEKSLDSW